MLSVMSKMLRVASADDGEGHQSPATCVGQSGTEGHHNISKVRWWLHHVRVLQNGKKIEVVD